MIGKMYKLKVYDNILSYTHSNGRIINEVYIPEIQIIFNSDGYIFSNNTHRSEDDKIINVNINNEIAMNMLEYINNKNNLTNFTKEFFKKVDKYIIK